MNIAFDHTNPFSVLGFKPEQHGSITPDLAMKAYRGIAKQVHNAGVTRKHEMQVLNAIKDIIADPAQFTEHLNAFRPTHLSAGEAKAQEIFQQLREAMAKRNAPTQATEPAQAFSKQQLMTSTSPLAQQTAHLPAPPLQLTQHKGPAEPVPTTPPPPKRVAKETRLALPEPGPAGEPIVLGGHTPPPAAPAQQKNVAKPPRTPKAKAGPATETVAPAPLPTPPAAPTKPTANWIEKIAGSTPEQAKKRSMYGAAAGVVGGGALLLAGNARAREQNDKGNSPDLLARGLQFAGGVSVIVGAALAVDRMLGSPLLKAMGHRSL